MSNKNYRRQQCTDHCVGMCAKDWEPLDDNYKPERALQWFGVAVMAWCALFLLMVLL